MTISSKKRGWLAVQQRIPRPYVWASQPWCVTRLTSGFRLCAARSLVHATCTGVVKGRRPNERSADGAGGHVRVDSVPCQPGDRDWVPELLCLLEVTIGLALGD